MLWIRKPARCFGVLNARFSNVVASPKAVFWLAQDGELVASDPVTGERIEVLQALFSPGEFVLNDSQHQLGFYYLAYDPTSNILVAYLGDSCQLFAFRVGEIP